MIFKTLVGFAAAAVIVGVGVYLWDRQQVIQAAQEARQAQVCAEAESDFDSMRRSPSVPTTSEVRRTIRRVEECGYTLTASDRQHPNILPTLDPEAAQREAERIRIEREREYSQRRCSSAINDVNIAAAGRSPVMGNMIVAIKTARECGMEIPKAVADRYE